MLCLLDILLFALLPLHIPDQKSCYEEILDLSLDSNFPHPLLPTCLHHDVFPYCICHPLTYYKSLPHLFVYLYHHLLECRLHGREGRGVFLSVLFTPVFPDLTLGIS